MRVAPLLVGLIAALVAAALLPAGPLTFVLFATLSGAPLALRLARRWDPVELFGVSVALSLVVFAVLTPLAHKAGIGSALPFASAGIGVVVLATAGRPRRIRFAFRAATFVFAVLVGAAATWVALRNGSVSSGGDATYEARNWYARDSFYLFALVESIRAHGSPPSENPFLSGAPHIYPTAFHGALAGMLGSDPRPAAVALPRPFVLFLVAAAGLLMAAARRWGRRGRDGPLFAAAVGVFLLRPDFFVYPQSQPLALLVLLLLIGCLGPRPALAPRRRLAVAALLAVLLPWAHAVTAGVAMAVLAGAVLALAKDRHLPRAAFLGVALVAAAACFIFVNRAPVPGPGGAVWDAGARALIRRYDAAWVLPFAGLLLLLFARGRAGRVTSACVATLGVLALGFGYTAFGVTRLDSVERWFVIFNAQRFFLLAVVVALPLLVVRRPAISWTAAALFVAGALLMPGEVARDTWLLVRAEPLVVSPARLEALDVIRRSAPPGARFITTARDQVLPAFTGRAQLANDAQNLWGMNTVSPRDFALRLAAQDRCFADLMPRQRRSLLDHFGITHLMVDGAWPDDEAAMQWLGRSLPPGDARPLFRNAEVLVVERLRSED